MIVPAWKPPLASLVVPVGEYAQSALGRERMFEYGSHRYGTPVTILRLNYATEMRYGVLVDIGRKVYMSDPVDLTMGYANVIWQGDANSVCLRSLALCSSPPRILNVTGPDLVSVRNAGKVLLHGELLTRVWGPEYRDEVDYLWTYVRYLRNKIEPDPAHPRYILSEPGVGYTLVAGTPHLEQ